MISSPLKYYFSVHIERPEFRKFQINRGLALWKLVHIFCTPGRGSSVGRRETEIDLCYCLSRWSTKRGAKSIPVVNKFR